jgi:hypothetical protein
MVLTACHSFSIIPEGHTVRQEARIPLEPAGPHKNIWRTDDLTLQYEYSLKENQMMLEGTIDLDGMQHFSTVTHLSFRIFFLDTEFKIVKVKPFFSAGNETIKVWRFKMLAEIPADAAGFAFDYSGQAAENGGFSGSDDQGGGISKDFWFRPF